MPGGTDYLSTIAVREIDFGFAAGAGVEQPLQLIRMSDKGEFALGMTAFHFLRSED